MAVGLYLNPKVGDIVYPSFTPQKIAKVVSIHLSDSDEDQHRITVKFKNGDLKTKVLSRDFKNYEDLIEDHRNKYERHLKIFEEFKNTDCNVIKMED